MSWTFQRSYLRHLFFFLFISYFSFAGEIGFRVGLANIFFFGALFEDNIANPPFNNPMANPPSRKQEIEVDRMSLEYLARYFRYLNADVLVLCEAPSNLKDLENFVADYLDSEYEIIHNSPVVEDKKYYFEQQIAALVRKDLFSIRRYEALNQESVTDSNRRYPFPSSGKVKMMGEELTVYWSRFPIEFDLSLKEDPGHWYKFIATYPKSKASRNREAARKARMKNFEQQRMIRSRVESVASEYEDILVLGDMNDSLGMDPVEEKLGIDSLTALYQGEGDPVLWDPVRFKSGEGTYIYKGVPEVIDYIFLSHGLKSGKGRVLAKDYEYFHFFQTMIRQNRPSRPDRLKHRELFLSDHGPITVDIIHSAEKKQEN